MRLGPILRATETSANTFIAVAIVEPSLWFRPRVI
jgi:hypothetical protein